MSETNYNQAVTLLARIVSESNIECVKQINQDDPVEASKILDDFANYGTDEETVRTVLNSLFVDVSEAVIKLQTPSTKTDKIPDGYTIYKESTDHVILAVTDFLEMFKDAPGTIVYNNETYVRGDMEPIPHDLAGHVCSMRRYIKKTS